MVNSSEKKVMVIDELNRANVPRVFGELFYALEYRDKPIDLMYSRGYRLPRGLLFIATMNTADRSIRSIDAALRRRFEIFDLPPRPELIDRYYEIPSRTNTVPNLSDGLVSLNERLGRDLNKHYLIGHTFLMKEVMDRRALERTWDRQIKPLIEEFFFDQLDEADKYTLEEFWPDG